MPPESSKERFIRSAGSPCGTHFFSPAAYLVPDCFGEADSMGRNNSILGGALLLTAANLLLRLTSIVFQVFLSAQIGAAASAGAATVKLFVPSALSMAYSFQIVTAAI